MAYYSTVLRFPGGKSFLYDFLAQVIKLNKIGDCTYIEPFAGGAGAALKLLYNENVSNVILNDIDPAIISIWKCVLWRTDEFIEKIYETPVTVNEWHHQKNILFTDYSSKDVNELELGFAAFFLNRCNWSGILNARPIGGLKQTGKWKIDARYNKENLISKIKAISEYNGRIQLFNLDALHFIKELSSMPELDADCVLVYCDPPYYEKGESLYRYYFVHEDHIEFSNIIKKETQFKWLLSYDDIKSVHEVYREVARNIFNLNYFAHSLKLGRELIMSSHNCYLPESFCIHSKEEKLKRKPPVKNSPRLAVL